MKKLINDLWYKRRDLVSDGFNESLSYISKEIPIKIIQIPSGKKCWTWTIPEKWTIKKASIKSLAGKTILDIKHNPLHVVSYSLPIDKIVTKEELLNHVHTKPSQPNAIPFEFKYYQRDWGFCMAHNQLKQLTDKKYKVLIESAFTKDYLKIGELTIHGKSKKVIVLIAHLCHPGMANDDLSGVSVLVDIAKELLKNTHNYTYKIIFVPETIGSIAYLSKNQKIIPYLKYGIFLEMLGNNNYLSLQHSYPGNSDIDKISNYVLSGKALKFREGKFHKIVVNDEMVFNGPGLKIPTISLSRYPYPEYHTSLDTPKIIFEKKLIDAKKITLEIIDILDKNYYPKRNFIGPVFLSGYNLWIDWRKNPKLNSAIDEIMLRLEGNMSIFDITNDLNLDFYQVYEYMEKFAKNKLIYKKYR